MPKQRTDEHEHSKRAPKQPAQEDGTYPGGLEQEREQPAEGDDKPRPSDAGRKR